MELWRWLADGEAYPRRLCISVGWMIFVRNITTCDRTRPWRCRHQPVAAIQARDATIPIRPLGSMRKAPRCGDWNPQVNSCLTDAAGRSPGHWQESWCNWNVWSSGCWCSTATPSFANSTLPWSRKEKTAALPPWKTLRVSHFPFLRLPRLTNPKYQKSVKDVWRRCVKDVPRLYSLRL